MMKQSFHSLLNKELSNETFHQTIEENKGFSKELWKKVAQNGWLSVLAKGDMQLIENMTALDFMYLCESVGETLFPGPYSLVGGYIVPFLSQSTLTTTQTELLNNVVSGEQLITAVLPRIEKQNNRFNLIWPSIKIMEEENGCLLINGELDHILFAQHSKLLLLPIEDSNGKISVCLINTDREGITIVPQESVDLSKPQGKVVLDRVLVHLNDDFVEKRESDHSQRLFHQLMTYFICLNGEMVGGANKVLNQTVHYVKERKQFGVSVGSFQANKHMLADMYMMLEKARSFNIYVAFMHDQDSYNYIDIAGSRLFTAEMYKKICEDAIQLHGGMGFTWEEGIHFWYKTALFQLYHVADPTNLTQFILEELLKEDKEKITS